MHIAIVADLELGAPKGDAIRTVALASGLVENGHRVELIVPQSQSSGDGVAGLLTNVEVRELAPSYHGRNPWGIVSRKRALMLEAKKTQADVVQIETGFDAGVASILGLDNYVVDVHGFLFSELAFGQGPLYWRNPPALCKRLEQRGVRAAAHVIAVSQTMKEHLIREWGVRGSKVTVIPNGFVGRHVEKYRHVDRQPGLVAFLGSLTRWSCGERILRAAYVLRNGDLQFVIVGDGPERGDLERLKRELGLAHVSFTGFLQPEKALSMAAASEVLLAPLPDTLALRVACPIKVVEYSAMGRPIVADPVGDLPRRLVEGGGAVSPESSSGEGLAKAIKDVTEDDPLQRSLGEAARTICGRMDWRRLSSLLANLYETRVPSAG